MSDPLSEVIGEDMSKTYPAKTSPGEDLQDTVACTLCRTHVPLIVATINHSWGIRLCTSCGLALAHHVMNAREGIRLHYFSESDQDTIVEQMISQWE